MLSYEVFRITRLLVTMRPEFVVVVLVSMVVWLCGAGKLFNVWSNLDEVQLNPAARPARARLSPPPAF